MLWILALNGWTDVPTAPPAVKLREHDHTTFPNPQKYSRGLLQMFAVEYLL